MAHRRGRALLADRHDCPNGTHARLRDIFSHWNRQERNSGGELHREEAQHTHARDAAREVHRAGQGRAGRPRG